MASGIFGIFAKSYYIEYSLTYMLVTKVQQKIPSKLCHHTSLDALFGILGKDNICFWAVSNLRKNDDQEIQMGEYMLNRVREVVPNLSLLQKFGGYYESASISFMEGDSDAQMISKYGRYRLEFDLRGHVSHGPFTGGFMMCEYVCTDELEAYADEFCDCITHYIQLAPENVGALMEAVSMEYDAMYKVFTIKEEQWSNEKEWRQIVHLKEGEEDVYYTKEGKPYKNYYFPKEALTGVTIFCKSNEDYSSEIQKIKSFLKLQGYDVPVRTNSICE